MIPRHRLLYYFARFHLALRRPERAVHEYNEAESRREAASR
jgi:hypothetical protein